MTKAFEGVSHFPSEAELKRRKANANAPARSRSNAVIKVDSVRVNPVPKAFEGVRHFPTRAELESRRVTEAVPVVPAAGLKHPQANPDAAALVIRLTEQEGLIAKLEAYEAQGYEKADLIVNYSPLRLSEDGTVIPAPGSYLEGVVTHLTMQYTDVVTMPAPTGMVDVRGFTEPGYEDATLVLVRVPEHLKK